MNEEHQSVIFSAAAYEAHEYRHERKCKSLTLFIIILAFLFMMSNILWAFVYCSQQIDEANQKNISTSVSFSHTKTLSLDNHVAILPAEKLNVFCEKQRKYKKDFDYV